MEESDVWGDMPTGCEKYLCTLNDGGMCTSELGCMYYESDLLNFIAGGVTDGFENFNTSDKKV